MNYTYPKKIAAFTLIEILIALVIFAILGVIVAFGLRRALQSNQRADAADKRIQAIEVAQALIRRDITNIVDRSITDRDGQTLPAFLLKVNEIDFTRGGIINPFSTSNRSDLQRISYTYQDNKIIRTVWPTLDRMSNTTSVSAVVLNNVTGFSVQVYDNQNQLQNAWPYNTNSNAISSSSNQQTDLPKAVKIIFSIQDQGSIEDIVAIPSRGLINNSSEAPSANAEPQPPKS